MEVTILLGDRILVKPDPIKETLGNTDLVKTDAMKAAELPSTGEVKFVSEFCKFVKAGDRIIYNRHAGVQDEVHGEKLLIMTEGSVWLITDRA